MVRPGVDRPGVDRLALVLGGRRMTVDARCVVRIEETPTVGSLPLAPPPVRGIVAVDGRPATMIGEETGPMVAVSCEGGLLALRVAAIEICGAQDTAPPLDLGALAPWTRLVPLPARGPAGPVAEGSARLMALRVIVGDQTVLIPLAGIRRVAPVDTVREDGGDGPLVLVEGRLRRGRSLSRWCGLPDLAEPTALLPVGHEEAITVQRVAGLATLRADRLLSVAGETGAAARQWVVAPDGTMTEWLPVDRIVGRVAGRTGAAGGRPADGAADGIADTGPTAGANRRHVRGLRLTCGDAALAVPLDGVLGLVDPVSLTWQPHRKRHAGMVPVVDLRRLFGEGGETGPSRRCRAVSLALGGLALGGVQPVIVLADEAALDADLAAPDWMPPPPLPPGASSLIDAVRPDGRTGGWVLRLRLAPSSPFALRSAAAAGLAGWADACSLATIGRFPARPHPVPSGVA